ncbi:MAG TPA: hypothetical protein VEJ18_20620 [Planctomycetota bacterium]|nr:hypothetical protein [Planctomycetota bacterium]
MTSVGLELGYDHGLLCASATLENSGRGDLDVWVAGLHVGIRTPVPLEEDRTLRLTVGLLRGTADVEADGFGEFEDAFGLEARLGLTLEPAPGWEIGLFGAYRLLAFDYTPPVDSGDEELRGRSFVGGATLAFRF